MLNHVVNWWASQVSSGGMKWTTDAEEMAGRLSSKHSQDLCREAERRARDSRSKEVNLSHIFSARLDPSAVYPVPNTFHLERHEGPVHAIACSPFHRALFLSCGADGLAKLYSTLQSRPILTFEPSSSYLMDVSWSCSRPLVFAAVAEDGGLFLYDLMKSPVMPVTSASLPGTGGDKDLAGATYAVAFNPRQRDLIASGDSHGRVLIWRMSWRLANKRPGEDRALDRLFRNSMGEAGEEEDTEDEDRDRGLQCRVKSTGQREAKDLDRVGPNARK
ncbi:unnamed protein product [Discosporangium mesarthrocarpum]